MPLNIYQYSNTVVAPGTYKAYMEFWNMSYNWNTQESIYNDDLSARDVEVTITHSGNNYTITIPETTVNVHRSNVDGDDSVIGTTAFSFSYSGQLTHRSVEDK